ncbi:sigma-54-dependent transcriptional regulator [Tepidanaerobacter syntrophicus]|uniref:sigma-54-dependent transcriptional regulator n=1 Tax=Tepidanaerobacter syntrophicus TaxID=224999 RepID=UPI001BD53113|nr:sigma-54-dependent transcriptional regulator [Tepidanaerobacter syntrophicus]
MNIENNSKCIYPDKLSRKEKVHEKLIELTKKLESNELKHSPKVNFNTSSISKLLGISRNNTSKELNCLVRNGDAIKIRGKPVFYFDKKVLESKLGIKFNRCVFDSYELFRETINASTLNKNESTKRVNNVKLLSSEIDNLQPKEISDLKVSTNENLQSSILDSIIGSESSLRIPIEQAKAAILYPPKGLNTLIIGPTGVGKTTFAEAMYLHAIESKRVSRTAPFIVFNCADYADNPQLLISQLFGHAKGAFTGADKEKQGLVDKANGGILFLDEVHRLPPEGQEMMFLLMDKGIYRRLGESDGAREANILIIAATTEDPQSAILHTFLRRIPVIIRLPSLQERTLQERMALICRFFQEESLRIKMPLIVASEVIKALMLYECPGNLGQLKSDIQLICARAFLDSLTYGKSEVEVKLLHISEEVRKGFFEIENKREDLTKYFNLNSNKNIIFNSAESNPSEINKKLFFNDYKGASDFYELIQHIWEKSLQEGLSEEETREKLSKEANYYLDNFFYKIKSKNSDINREALTKIVNPEIIECVESVLNEIKSEFGDYLSQRLIFGIALHVNTLLERLKIGTFVCHPDKENVAVKYPEEYSLAKRMKILLEEKIGVEIPEDEIAYLALFLYAAKMGKNSNNIGVLVIAHGSAAASTMAQVANTLLGVNHAHSIDIPLEEKVEVVLDKAIERVKSIDNGKGVILLVDMGSLVAFSQIITERTGIPTKVVEMVSTPMVIEATRKALMPNMDLESLVIDVKSLSPFIGNKNEEEILKNAYERRSHIQDIIINILSKTLTFLNPEKAYNILYEILKKITKDLNEDVDDDITLKFLFHCSCMIERVIRKDALPYSNLKKLINSKHYIFSILRKNFEIAEEIFGVNIPDTELAYIVEMFETHFDTLLQAE